MSKIIDQDGVSEQALEMQTGLVTMSDVARQAGLSRATVSKVINKSGYVRPETVARVQEVIQRLGYRPNEMARSLVRQKSLTIGAIFPWDADPWAGEILESMTPLAKEHGYHLVVYPGAEMMGDVQYAIDALMSWRVDAVITFVALGETTIKQLCAQGTRVVSWGFPLFDFPQLHFVCVDIELGLQRIATYLARLGHTNIAYVGYRDELIAALSKSVAEINPGIKLSQQVPVDHTSQAGAEAVGPLLAATNPLPTAIVCRTDTLAVGVLSGLDRAGLNVPEDVSVVGINDVQIARFTKPPLTTLRISPQVAARRMIETAVASLHGELMPKYQAITPELVVRESTAPAKY